MAFEFCCVVHFICYLRQLLCMYFFFSQCSVSVCCALHPCVVYLPIASSPKCADAQKGPRKSTSTLSLSPSTNHKQACLYIMLISVLHTSLSDIWIGFIFRFYVFSPSLSFYSVMVCVCGRVCFFFPHYFCYLLCFTSYLFLYCVTHSLFSTIIPYFASFK